MTNFKQFGKSPVLNDKLIRVDNDYDILFYFIKHYYRNAIRTCYLIQIKISSALAADKKHAFFALFFFVKKDLKVFLVFSSAVFQLLT